MPTNKNYMGLCVTSELKSLLHNKAKEETDRTGKFISIPHLILDAIYEKYGMPIPQKEEVLQSD